jgi:hypothetical protein
MKKLCAQQKNLSPGARVGKVKRRSIKFVEHLTGDGPTAFRHVCSIGLEGIVSKRVDAPYRSGPSRTWVSRRTRRARRRAESARAGEGSATVIARRGARGVIAVEQGRR